LEVEGGARIGKYLSVGLGFSWLYYYW
jgi:hypothetical protein